MIHSSPYCFFSVISEIQYHLHFCLTVSFQYFINFQNSNYFFKKIVISLGCTISLFYGIRHVSKMRSILKYISHSFFDNFFSPFTKLLQKNSNYILVSVIYSLIECALLFAGMIIMWILTIIFEENEGDLFNSNKSIHMNHKNLLLMINTFLVMTWLISTLFFGLCFFRFCASVNLELSFVLNFLIYFF